MTMKQLEDHTQLLSDLYSVVFQPPLEEAPSQPPSLLLHSQVSGDADPLRLIVRSASRQAGEPRPRRRRKTKARPEHGAEMKKRRLNTEQVNFLEMNFGDEHKLHSERKARLASALGLDQRQVAVWFQNRRARWKSKQREEDYNRLKSLYDHTNAEKCKLESEVAKLKEMLAEAEKEISRLSVKSCSPSSSFSGGAADEPPQTFAPDFEVDQQEYAMFSPETINIYSMDWAAFCASLF